MACELTRFFVMVYIKFKLIVTIQNTIFDINSIFQLGAILSRNLIFNLLDWYLKFQNTGNVLTTYKGSEKSVRHQKTLKKCGIRKL